MTIHTHHIINGVRVDLTPKEILESENARIAYEAGAYTRKAVLIRIERNAKLAETDWTQLADTSADKVAWATYRQALRDVPAQAGFPWTITYPDKPE